MRWLGLIAVVALLSSCASRPAPPGRVQSFKVRGVLQELKPDGRTAVIQHEVIRDYMEAMTMAFHARTTHELIGLQPGDIVTFRLSVTDDESWIDRVVRTGRAVGITTPPAPPPVTNATPRLNIVEGLAAFAFTNEFGKPVSFSDYKGHAIGLTFFFTRCPLPEYCPRLTKNFLSATRKLKTLPNAPTNWHLFSISFDTRMDTPAVLRNYALGYGYDSNRWSFITSSQAVIDEVARRFNFNYRQESGTYAHHFFTLVLDAGGYWHAGWPVGGDTSDNLVEEIVKGAAVAP